MVMQVGLGSKKYPGLVALVDDEDYERVSSHRWSVATGGGPNVPKIYAKCWRDGRPEMLHNFLTGSPETDHRNGNGLDNRRCNLRPANRGQNLANTSKRTVRKGVPTSSRFKGVHRVPSGNWRADIVAQKIRYCLGTFPLEEDAAKAYDHAALELFGEFARTNEMMGLL